MATGGAGLATLKMVGPTSFLDLFAGGASFSRISSGLLMPTGGGGFGTSKMVGTACILSRFVPGKYKLGSKCLLHILMLSLRYFTDLLSRSFLLVATSHVLDLTEEINGYIRFCRRVRSNDHLAVRSK